MEPNHEIEGGGKYYLRGTEIMMAIAYTRGLERCWA